MLVFYEKRIYYGRGKTYGNGKKAYLSWFFEKNLYYFSITFFKI